MTSRFKDFGAGTAAADFGPLSFKLHGEEFQCRPAVQGKTMLQLVQNSNSEDGAAMAKIVDEFFATALLPDSLERFNTLLADPDKIVTVDTLTEIVSWLVEEYTGRPTQQPEPSSTGQ